MDIHTIHFNARGEIIGGYIHTEDNEEINFSIEDVEFMQFTGLTDKNGKDVYEGDVVLDPGGNRATVEWVQDHCQFLAIFDSEVQEIGDWCEVIGNRFEHPHLLTSDTPK